MSNKEKKNFRLGFKQHRLNVGTSLYLHFCKTYTFNSHETSGSKTSLLFLFTQIMITGTDYRLNHIADYIASQNQLPFMAFLLQ